MKDTMEAYWHWLCSSLAGEPSLLWRLIGQYKTPRDIFYAKDHALHSV